jgi:hypothetical protein
LVTRAQCGMLVYQLIPSWQQLLLQISKRKTITE